MKRTDLEHSIVLERGDDKFLVQVSPCVWMYSNYGMQISICHGTESQPNIAVQFFQWKCFYEDCTTEELRRKAGEFLDQEGMQEKLKKQLADWLERDAAYKKGAEARAKEAAIQIAAQDAEYKAKGFTHRIDAWVHPAAGGDDYPIRFYGQHITEKDVQSQLRKQGSAVLTDYKITALG